MGSGKSIFRHFSNFILLETLTNILPDSSMLACQLNFAKATNKFPLKKKNVSIGAYPPIKSLFPETIL